MEFSINTLLCRKYPFFHDIAGTADPGALGVIIILPISQDPDKLELLALACKTPRSKYALPSLHRGGKYGQGAFHLTKNSENFGTGRSGTEISWETLQKI